MGDNISSGSTPSPSKQSSSARTSFSPHFLLGELTRLAAADSRGAEQKKLLTPVVRSKRTPIACTECRRRQVKVSRASSALPGHRSDSNYSALVRRHSANDAASAPLSANTSHAVSKKPRRAALHCARRTPTTSCLRRHHISRGRYFTARPHRGSQTTTRMGPILITHIVIGQARTLECRCPSHKLKDSAIAEYRCIRAPRGPFTMARTTARRRMGTNPLARLLPLSRTSLLTTPTKGDYFPVPILVRTQTWDPVTLDCHTRTAQILGGLLVKREYRLSTRESSNVRCEKQRSISSMQRVYAVFAWWERRL